MAKKKRPSRRPEAEDLKNAGSSWKRTFWVGLGLFVLAFLLYANTLDHAFVFDDPPLITQNLQVTELRWSDILGFHSYRPVRTFTYAVNYWLSGDDPWSYHLFNILLHALNGVFVLVFFQLLSRSLLVSSLGALLFVLHPVQTAAVAYVSGRKDLLATFFVLTGLIAYEKYRQQRKPVWLVPVVCLFGLGILSKEVALVFPILVFLLDLLRSRTDPNQSALGLVSSALEKIRVRGVAYLLLAVLALSGLLWATFIVEATRKVGFWGGSYLANLGTSFKLFAHYLKLLVWPDPLIADYSGGVFSVSSGFLEPATLLAVLLTAGYLFVSARLFSRTPLISSGMFWVAASLLPVLQLIPFHEVAADHFLYLPVVGAGLVFGSLVEKTFKLPRYGSWVSLLVVGLVSSASAARVVDRNRDWRNEESLWQATYDVAPSSFRANVNLSRVLFEKASGPDDIRHSITLLDRALELKPDDALVRGNLGVYHYTLAERAWRNNQLDRTEELLGKASNYLTQAQSRGMEKDSAVLSGLANISRLQAKIFYHKGENERAAQAHITARQLYEQALKTDRRLVTKANWYNYAMLYADAGDHAKAVRYLQRYLRFFPDANIGHAQLGIHLFHLKRFQESIPYLERASRQNPQPETLGTLAESYINLGRRTDAIGVQLRAEQYYPQDPAVHFNLGVLYQQVGDRQKAKQRFENVLRLPGRPELKAPARARLQQLGP